MLDVLAIGILLLLTLYTVRYLARSFKNRHYKQSFTEAVELVGMYGYKVYQYSPSDTNGTTDVLEALAIINDTPNTIVMNSSREIVGGLNEYPVKSIRPKVETDDRLRLVIDNAGHKK